MKNKKMEKGGKKSGVMTGMLIGAALGVAAGILLESKEKRKKLGTQARQISADFYRYAAPRLKKAKKIGEAQYGVLVKEAAKRFGKGKNLSRPEVRRLLRAARASWKRVKKNL